MFWCYVSAKEMAGFREMTALYSDHLYDRFYACTLHAHVHWLMYTLVHDTYICTPGEIRSYT